MNETGRSRTQVLGLAGTRWRSSSGWNRAEVEDVESRRSVSIRTVLSYTVRAATL